MEALQALSKVLMIPPALMLIYDLCYFWFVKNMFKLQSTKEWITKISPGLAADAHTVFMKMGTLGPKIESAPACFAFFVPALGLYLLYRLLFLLQGGKAGGYKSRY